MLISEVSVIFYLFIYIINVIKVFNYLCIGLQISKVMFRFFGLKDA